MNSGEIRNGSDASMPVLEVVLQVQNELRELLRQRAEVMRRIGTVKKTIAGLVVLFGDGVLEEDLRDLVDGGSRERKAGLTRSCRNILMEADQALTAREVRNRMNERFPALLARHKDPIASVTTVLNRLVDYGEVQRVTSGENGRAWLWIAEPGKPAGRRLKSTIDETQ